MSSTYILFDTCNVNLVESCTLGIASCHFIFESLKLSSSPFFLGGGLAKRSKLKCTDQQLVIFKPGPEESTQTKPVVDQESTGR